MTMIRITTCALALALSAASSLPVLGQSNKQGNGSAPCSVANSVFQHGEEITYVIYYNLSPMWVAAGEVTFKVMDEGNAYHFQAIGRTYKQHDWYFKVRDTYESWVDKHTLLPTYSVRNISEGKYELLEKTAYDQGKRETTVWRDRKKGNGEQKTQHKTTTCVHDVLSIMYHLRNIDFEQKGVGAVSPFTIYIDKEEFPLRMKYAGKESRRKVYGIGHYRLMRFEPDLIAGEVFKGNAKMTVWVSDDQNKIPVYIESPLSVGSVKVVLKDFKGLKYDFTARVQ